MAYTIRYNHQRLWCWHTCDDVFHVLAGYIGEFELVDDHRAGKIVVELNGRLNKCGVISPRYNIGVAELEDWTARLLPSRQVCSLTTYQSALWFRVQGFGYTLCRAWNGDFGFEPLLAPGNFVFYVEGDFFHVSYSSQLFTKAITAHLVLKNVWVSSFQLFVHLL
jgi:hypothetical protein